jgi:hypothetical protein
MRSGRLLVASGLVVAAFVGYGVLHDPPLDQPCPTGDRTGVATQVHIAPTLVHHQNWVDVDPSPIVSGRKMWVYACIDGLVIGRRTTTDRDVDPATGAARIKIPTRWVDLTWLTGDLERFRDPARWTVVYTPA